MVVPEDAVRENWNRLRKAKPDSDDPYVVAARRRLARWIDVPYLGEKPYFVERVDAAEVIGRLGVDGFDLVEIDCSGFADETALLQALGRVHEFPDYYGENWDAYVDCFGTTVEESDQPLAVVLSGLDRLRDRDFRTFFRCVHQLEMTSEMIGMFRPVIPRMVIHVHVGNW